MATSEAVAAVTLQPGGETVDNRSSEWMQPPSYELAPTNCPPGLEHLAALPEILVKQRVHGLELDFGCSDAIQYDIVHPETGKLLYEVIELTYGVLQKYCGSYRPFDRAVFDCRENAILLLSRPFNCAGCCCSSSCTDEIVAYSFDGAPLGSVKQLPNWCDPSLNVYDADDNVVFNIKGPRWYCNSCDEISFKIYAQADNREYGVISKKSIGDAEDCCCTLLSSYRIAFPDQLDVRLRAVILAACFSIDLLYFQKSE